jgi:hypothetical protein
MAAGVGNRRADNNRAGKDVNVVNDGMAHFSDGAFLQLDRVGRARFALTRHPVMRRCV